ncbi:MAG TPA: hypothetical protein VF960_12560 [Chloroflexota bacterium]
MAARTTGTAAESKALTVASSLSSDELTALLQQTGWAEKGNGEAPLRMKLDGNALTTPDGGMYMYNPTKPKVPAMTVRIVKPPEEYWAIWVDDAAAASIGTPEMSGTFSKKYIHPDPTRRVWDSDLAFDQLKAAGNKPSWKGDLLLQIIPDEGQLKGDEPVYTLTLNTTSLIEFKGTSRTPEAGVVSEKNFIRKLSEFAIAEMEPGTDPKKAVLDALTSLTLGGIAAEVRIVRAENKELGRTWPVIVFDPVLIQTMEPGDALLGPGDDLTDDPDEVKF